MSSDRSFPQRGPSTPVFQTTTIHTAHPVVSSSTTAAYGVLVLIAIYYFLQYLEAHHLPLSELLWNSIVYVTPSKMLSLLDPEISSSVPQEPEDDSLNVPKGFNSQHHASKSNATRKALRELTESLNDEANVGRTFWTPSALKSMSSWQQQDAQEYFSKITDSLEKDAVRAKRMSDCQVGLQALSTNDDEGKKRTASGTSFSTPQAIRMSQLPEELHSMVLNNPLEGLLAQRVGCQQCGYVEGLSMVPFNCLTVPLGRQWMYDIRECLDEYTALEPINGVECAKCTLLKARSQMEQVLKQLLGESNPNVKNDHSTRLASLREDARQRLGLIQDALSETDFSDSALKKCQIPAKSYVLTTKSRQAVIARAPKALVIHVNRSIFDELTGEQSKNQATVRFPKRFNLGSWCLGTEGNNLENPTIESWNTDPKKSMLNDNEDGGESEFSPSYELRAVVTHYGRHENGHYICYRQSPYISNVDDDEDGTESAKRTGPWWRLSDEEVKEVSEETVLAQGGVFMLFYEQVPSKHRSLPAVLDQTNVIPSIEEVETAITVIAEDQGSVSVVPKMGNEMKTSMAGASAYPTPPPEEQDTGSQGAATKPDSKSLIHGQAKAPWSTSIAQASSNPVRAAHIPEIQSSSTSKILTPSSASNIPRSSNADIDRFEAPQVDLTPPPAKTISPRTGRRKGTRSGKAMESMAGSVQAN